MTTQPEEAVGSEPIVDAPLSPEDRLNAAFADPENRQEDEPEEGAIPAEVTEDDLEDEAEADDLPPIDAPVSWDAEAKERFAKLPRDDQEYLVKREGERERFVQTKSQEAARAKQETEQAALGQLAQIERQYAQQFHSIAQQIEPVRPDYTLLATNPMEYARQGQEYDHAIAQRQHAQQMAEGYAQQAQQREAQAEQAFHAEQVNTIVQHFPEYTDPTTGPKLQQELSAVARELGYPPELIAEARATDILAMRKANEWKAKADKLDRLEAKKMEKVRAAKTLPKVAKPGSAPPPGAAQQQRYATDRDAMRNGDKDATTRVLDSFFQPKK